MIKIKILSFFVTAPAWRIFSLFILPFIISLFFSFSLTAAVVSKMGIFFSVTTFLVWIYSFCVLINERYSTYLNVPIHQLIICLAYNFIHTCLFIFDIIPRQILIPLYLLSIVCNVYVLYFFSKLLVMNLTGNGTSLPSSLYASLISLSASRSIPEKAVQVSYASFTQLSRDVIFKPNFLLTYMHN